MNLKVGHQTEQAALIYLQNRGLKLLARNFRSKLGEIDLVMQDKECIVFVEVRYRTSVNLGHPAETITYQKRKRIIDTAYYYLLKQNLIGKVSCRFDILAITANQEFNWLQNAFELEETSSFI